MQPVKKNSITRCLIFLNIFVVLQIMATAAWMGGLLGMELWLFHVLYVFWLAPFTVAVCSFAIVPVIGCGLLKIISKPCMICTLAIFVFHIAIAYPYIYLSGTWVSVP